MIFGRKSFGEKFGQVRKKVLGQVFGKKFVSRTNFFLQLMKNSGLKKATQFGIGVLTLINMLQVVRPAQ